MADHGHKKTGTHKETLRPIKVKKVAKKRGKKK